MVRIAKLQKPLAAAAFIGTLGLAAYGAFHTISAMADYGSPLPADQAALNSADQGQAKPDGAFCNPYGCAGCSGCASLQYQQNITQAPETANRLAID